MIVAAPALFGTAFQPHFRPAIDGDEIVTQRPLKVVGLVWYWRGDYPRILQIMADADELPRTWEKWAHSAEKILSRIAQDGTVVEKVYLDPDAFPQWCEARGVDLDAKARNTFAGEFVADKYRRPE